MTFAEVEEAADYSPEHAILRLQGLYGKYRVLVTELLAGETRKYSYYLLRSNWVEAGFDNSPDPRAIRLKHGTIGEEHAGELVPHLHLEDKTRLLLTEEMTFETFLDWIKTNMPPGES